MADNNYNMVKPVGALQNITGITPTKQRQKRKRKQNQQQQNEEEDQQEQIDDEEQSPDDEIDQNGLDQSSLDYCA